MDKPTEKPIRHLTKKVRKVDVKKARNLKISKGKAGSTRNVTREQFHSLVKKSAQPVKTTNESDSASDGT